MRYTLLEIVQSVLSSMDSDEVNSINDTVESAQVVKVIKTVYDDIQTRGNLAIQKTLFNLTSSGDITKPVLMTKPNSIGDIEWVRYNIIKAGDTIPAWQDIQFLPIDQFAMLTQSYNTTALDVDTMALSFNGFNFTFYFKNNVKPCYYTSFNDNTLIFDAYDSAVDTTLQSAKTLCFGVLSNTFTEMDNWVPNLQDQQFALLLNEAKSLAWAELKQTTHAKAEQTARRNWRHLAHSRVHTHDQRFRHGNHSFDQLPNYGRKCN